MRSLFFVFACIIGFCVSAVSAQVLVRSIPAPSASAQALTYDGEAFWAGDNSNRLVRFSLVDGAPLDTILSPVNGSDGLSYHDGALWTISGSLSRRQIFKMDPVTGALLDSIPDPADGYSGGMAAQEGNFWISRYFPSDKMLKVSATTGQLLDSLDAFGEQVRGVAYSDGYLWTTSVDPDSDRVFRFDAVTGALNWQFALPEHASLPDRRIRGLAWVDGFLWIVALDQSSNVNKVLQYDVSNAISPDIQVDSTLHDFGGVVIGHPVDWLFNVTNVGNVTLTVDSYSFDVGDFYSIISPAIPAVIAAGQTQPFVVRFDPQVPGSFMDTLAIFSNDPDESPVSIILFGISYPDEGDIAVSPSNIDFGTVWFPLPTLSTSRLVTVLNDGHGLLTVSAAEVIGSQTFRRDNLNLPAVLAPQESLLIRVWYEPFNEDVHGGLLTILSDDPGTPQFNVTLTGTGVIAGFEAGETIWTWHDPLDGFDVGINSVKPIADVNGDGIPDAIASGGTGLTVCLNGSSASQGDTLWTYNSRSDPEHAGMVYADRAVSAIPDVTGDGIQDVVIGTTGNSRSVIALSGQTGEELWVFDTREWGEGGWVYVVEPFVDISGDMVPDVLAGGGTDGSGSGPRRIFALNGTTGALLWEGPAYEAHYAVDVIADITSDGIPEIVTGTTSWVLAINGWSGEQVWRASIGANYYVPDLEWIGNANPVDNQSEDVVAISSGLGIYAIDGLDGEQLWLHPISGSNVYELTVIPDMTGDDVREVVYGTVSGSLVCLDGAEGEQLWTSFPEPDDPEFILCLETAPDLNDDGITDLICGTLGSQAVAVSGWDGEPLFSTFGSGAFDAVDAIAVMPDIDGSDRIEILMGNREGWVDCVSTGRAASAVEEPLAPVAEEFVLHQAYPNPFNPSTTISFSLPRDGRVTMNIYNTCGQLVETLLDEPLAGGSHQVSFVARHLPSGLYFCRVNAENFVATQKLVLLK